MEVESGGCDLTDTQAMGLSQATWESLMGTDSSQWLLMRKEERFQQILSEDLGAMRSPEVAKGEGATMAQDSSRARDWARGWRMTDGVDMKRVEAPEQDRSNHSPRGTGNRWFDELSCLLARSLHELTSPRVRRGGEEPRPACTGLGDVGTFDWDAEADDEE
jgi:hypothetical protein